MKIGQFVIGVGTESPKGLVVYYLWGGASSFAALSRHFKANPPKPFEVFNSTPHNKTTKDKNDPQPFLCSYWKPPPVSVLRMLCESN